jgi:hypothetical protein
MSVRDKGYIWRDSRRILHLSVRFIAENENHEAFPVFMQKTVEQKLQSVENVSFSQITPGLSDIPLLPQNADPPNPVHIGLSGLLARFYPALFQFPQARGVGFYAQVFFLGG